VLSYFIARRYLFSKKSINAINLITGISVVGIAIGTAALALELSVFNGFEVLLSGLFNKFNPELKITAAEGKFFEEDKEITKKLLQIPGVKAMSASLEEVVIFQNEGNIVFGTLKGVDSAYRSVTNIDSTIIAGEFSLGSQSQPGVVMGSLIKNRLGVALENPFTRLTVHMPGSTKPSLSRSAFITRQIHPTGTFSFQHEYDNQYAFSNLNFVASLFGKRGHLSSLELKLESGSDLESVKNNIRELLGRDFIIRDRYEQDEAFFKLMNLEKWMFYALFTLTLILVTFNIVGALWMTVLDKRKDIIILKAMGGTRRLIHRIFIGEGLLMSACGVLAGGVLTLILYIYHVQFGLISVPEGFIIDKYPMSLRWTDFLVVGLTMCLIGYLASILPARRARDMSPYIRDQ